MSARKFGRLAGFVFVLAAVFGGAGAASASAEHKTVVSAHAASQVSEFQLIDINWT
jgi:hypothetical protein